MDASSSCPAKEVRPCGKYTAVKKLLLIPFLMLACFVQGQDMIRKSAVPPSVLEEFDARFVDVTNIVWLRTSNDYYIAKFKIKDQKAQSVFQEGGEWMETEQEIGYLEMPDSARAYCRGNYSTYYPKKIQKVSTRKYGILYEIAITGEGLRRDLTFNMHGKLVAEKESALEEEKVAEEEAPTSIKDKMGKLFRKKDKQVGE